MVAPWHDDGKLIGFIELGMEISHLIEVVEHDNAVRILTLIDKSILDEAHWQSAASLLGGDVDANRVPGFVLLSSRDHPVPAPVLDALVHGGPIDGFLQFKRDGESWLAKSIALRDVNNRLAGYLVVQRNVTPLRSEFVSSIAINAATATLTIVLSIWFVWRILGEVERKILAARIGLERAVEVRTEELSRLNQDLIAENAERRESETALRKNQKSLHDAQAIAHIGIWEWNILSGDLQWSDEIFRIFGQKPQAFGASYKAFLETIHPDDRHAVENAVTAAVEHGEHYSIEHRIVRPDGEIRHVHEQGEVTLNNEGVAATMLGTVLDITERKKAEALNNRLGRILEESLNEIYVFDANTYAFIQVNKGALSNLGYEIEEIRGMKAYDLKPLFDSDSFTAALALLRSGERRILTFETESQRKDGTRYPVEMSLQYYSDEHPPVFVAVAYDITERKIAEREIADLNTSLEQRVAERTIELENQIAANELAQASLAEAIERNRAIVDTAADGIVTTSDRGVILSFNRAAETMFKMSANDVLGENVSILMSSTYAERHDGYLRRYLAGNSDAPIMGVIRELKAVRGNGEEFPIELAVSESKTGDTRVFTGIIRDISERKEADARLRETLENLKRTQAELVESEKMASLGGLVAGVAHEINTPVGVGLTASTHLRHVTEGVALAFSEGKLKRSDLEKYISDADETSLILEANLRRASDLIRSFKQVAVDQTGDTVREFPLDAYVDEVLTSLQPKFKNTNYKIETGIDPNIVVVTNPGAISQTLTNLVVNSLVHGFEGRDEGTIEITAQLEGDNVHIRYTDDGVGMNDETARRVFEPFFTTKRGKGGSGLGMHILYNLVTQSLGGTATCKSTQGSGATFDIIIPRVKESDDNG